MVQLFVVEKTDMIFLHQHLGLTWGKLSFHISKLEVENYIKVNKSIRNKKPYTVVSLTSKGRKEFAEYKEIMRELFV